MATKSKAKPAVKPKPPSKPWERLTNETAAAFSGFVQYRDMGPERSLAKVARLMGKLKPNLERWSAKHEWVKRTQAWDDMLDARRVKATTRAIEAMKTRHLQMATTLQGISASELNKLVEKAKTDKGAVITVDQLLRFVREGTTMERLNRGEPGDISEVHAQGLDLSELSMAELETLRELQTKARGGEPGA